MVAFQNPSCMQICGKRVSGELWEECQAGTGLLTRPAHVHGHGKYAYTATRPHTRKDFELLKYF